MVATFKLLNTIAVVISTLQIPVRAVFLCKCTYRHRVNNYFIRNDDLHCPDDRHKIGHLYDH